MGTFRSKYKSTCVFFCQVISGPKTRNPQGMFFFFLFLNKEAQVDFSTATVVSVQKLADVFTNTILKFFWSGQFQFKV